MAGREEGKRRRLGTLLAGGVRRDMTMDTWSALRRRAPGDVTPNAGSFMPTVGAVATRLMPSGGPRFTRDAVTPRVLLLAEDDAGRIGAVSDSAPLGMRREPPLDCGRGRLPGDVQASCDR